MQLEADLHTHTVASTHAYSTITENCEWAKKYGLKAVAMTDHGIAMPDSPHIWHFENMKCLPRKIGGVIVLHGIEANVINENGELDTDEKMLEKLDWVVASMHSYCFNPMTENEHTKAYLKLCRNKYVDVIGHCTTDYFPFDYEKCIKAFKEYGKYVEINESSIMNKRGSRKNSVTVLKLCKKYDVPVVVDSDSHYCSLVGQVSNAMEMIEELDFPKELVANADYETIRAHILKVHPNRDI